MDIQDEQEYSRDYIEEAWENGYWVTKEWKLIKVTDMTTDHIQNAIQMIERKFASVNTNVRDFEGNPTFMVLEIQDWCPAIVHLRNELAKRQ